MKNATLILECIPSCRERERSMNSIVLWRSHQVHHTLLFTCGHGVNSDKLNSGKINQAVLEDGKRILLVETEKHGLLRQAGRKLSGGVTAVYKYLRQRKNKRDIDLLMLKSCFGIGMNGPWIQFLQIRLFPNSPVKCWAGCLEAWGRTPSSFFNLSVLEKG